MSILPAPPPVGHVVCGIENIELSAPAITEAVRAAAPAGARLSFVHVSGTVASFTGGRTSRSASPEELQAELDADVHGWLDPLAARHGADAVVLVGDAQAQTLAEWARAEGAGLIVVCPHRRGLARILGSFASELVRDAPCPILLAPPG